MKPDENAIYSFYDKPSRYWVFGARRIIFVSFETFAVDGSGGEYVKFEDGSIGILAARGAVGRVAESMEDLL